MLSLLEPLTNCESRFALRDYQQASIAAVNAYFMNGASGVFLVLPTGGGKTVIFSEIIKARILEGQKCVIVAHRNALIWQAARTLSDMGILVGVIKAGPSTCPAAPVQVVSIDSMRGRDLPWEPDLIVLDEAHLAKARRYISFIDKNPLAKRLLVSATPIRLDGSGFDDLADELFIGSTINGLIEHTEGPFLVPPRMFTGVDFGSELGTVTTTAGDFNQAQVEQVMRQSHLVGNVVDEYLKHASGRKGVVFATGVQHSMDLAQAFCRANIPAEHIDGTMNDQQTAAVLERLKMGLIKIVCNANMLCEGWDEPSISYVGLARPTQSLALYIQQAGRGLRLNGPTWEASRANGKTDCIVIDHGMNVELHGHVLEERAWSLHGQGKVKVKRKKPKLCPKCGQVVLGLPVECSGCGHVFMKRATPMAVEGRLAEAKPVALNPIQKHYAKLLRACYARGYKPGKAWFQLQDRYGPEAAKQALSFSDSKRLIAEFYGPESVRKEG